MDEPKKNTFEKISTEISDEELVALTNAIKLRYGIDFTNYEKKSLKRGFARIISKYELGSLVGLWSKVLKDKQFILGCIDDLTVNLTELFRNPEIWTKLKQDILPLFSSKGQIDMWHAGCSTGEEIYTMAFVLSDVGMLFKTKSFATDLSQVALDKAIAGSFPRILFHKYEASFQKYLPLVDINRYFEFEEQIVKVKPAFKRHIQFERHNLVQDPVNKKFDIIFCRNVMIYFDETLKMKVLKLFYESLAPGGFFIIGYYDMLPEQHKQYFKLYDPTTRIYRKID
jgi:chemotaxis protein methyltransferase CheR